jgi:hypothetical protein
MSELYTFSAIANTVLLICMLFGGFFAFRSGKRQAIVNVQRETIDAQDKRIDAMEGKLHDLEKENDHLKFIIETIQAALQATGIAVTINGDLVTIRDQSGNASSMMRKPPITFVKPDEK